MSTSAQPPIFVTVVFAQKKPGAILSIPPLAVATTFHMRDSAFFTADGRELVILDDDTRSRVVEAFLKDPSSVFVVETGPLGFVADYPITPGSAS